MEIRICKDCLHIVKPSGALYQPHPNSICGDSRSLFVNFVTGEICHHLCTEININGSCEWFNKTV